MRGAVVGNQVPRYALGLCCKYGRQVVCYAPQEVLRASS